MKKKIIISVIVGVILFGAFAAVNILNPFNTGISPLQAPSEQEQTGRRLEFSFAYNKQRMVASSQYAFWIEDMDGNYINTVYVTRYTAKDGHIRRPKSLPLWVAAARPADLSASELDTIAGATPKSGKYLVVWDFTDRDGKPATDTQYRYFIEATMFNDDDVLYSGVIEAGEQAWAYNPAPAYTVPDSEYKEMIAHVRVAYYPN
jgi:hypothetical protein